MTELEVFGDEWQWERILPMKPGAKQVGGKTDDIGGFGWALSDFWIVVGNLAAPFEYGFLYMERLSQKLG